MIEFVKDSTQEHFKVSMDNIEAQNRLIKRLEEIGYRATLI
jgi:hypothetical protein